MLYLFFFIFKDIDQLSSHGIFRIILHNIFFDKTSGYLPAELPLCKYVFGANYLSVPIPYQKLEVGNNYRHLASSAAVYRCTTDSRHHLSSNVQTLSTRLQFSRMCALVTGEEGRDWLVVFVSVQISSHTWQVSWWAHGRHPAQRTLKFASIMAF